MQASSLDELIDRIVWASDRADCRLLHTSTAILIIMEGRFEVFQRFSGSKLALQNVMSRFATLNYHENGST